MSYSIIPIFIPHIGCPHDCVFCNQKRIAGVLHAPKPSEVSALLASGFQKTERAEIAFYGGSFTAISPDLQERYLQAVTPFRDRVSGIRLSTRPDAISEDVLEMLKRYGVGTVELGAQSMVDAVLRASQRGHTAEDTRRAAALIRGAGLKLVLQMMLGLPADDEQGALYTAREIAALKPDGVRVYPTVVVADTALAEQWENGEYHALSVSEAVELAARVSDVFHEADIPIIRMGLNPTEELSGGAVLAGAYHPAFGQLVAARRRLSVLRRMCAGLNATEITVFAHPRALSEVAGQHGENRTRLCEECSLRRMRILPDETLAYDEMRVEPTQFL